MKLGYRISGLHVENVIGSIIKFSIFSLPFAIWKMSEVFIVFVNIINSLK